MAECLFIGGFADGEWREVPEHIADLQLTEYPKGPIWHGSGLAEAQAIKKHPYERLTLAFPSGKISFFISKKISAIEAVHRLLKNYSPASER
jgi:hypothetical protein